MQIITKEIFDKVKAANPDVADTLEVLSHPDGFEIIVKAPPEVVYQRFTNERSDPTTRHVGFRNFVVACTVYPDNTELLPLLKSRPGLCDSFAGELAEMAGVSRAVQRKKF